MVVGVIGGGGGYMLHINTFVVFDADSNRTARNSCDTYLPFFGANVVV